jgi:site-specific recombinase XerD
MKVERSHSRESTTKPKTGAKIDRRYFVASDYGRIRVYTRRHINGCRLTDPDDNSCRCPKWLYSVKLDPMQQAAGTATFHDACSRAREMLHGFDPFIQKAQAAMGVAPAKTQDGMELAAAIDRWIAGLQSRGVSKSYRDSAAACFRRRAENPHAHRTGHRPNTSLLDYLDQQKRSVTRVDEITTPILDDWQLVWTLNDATAKHWRTNVKSFFRWAYNRNWTKRVPLFSERRKLKSGNRCGSFSDEQYRRLLAALPFYRARRGGSLPENYAERLGAFLDLGREGGMAVADIVKFRPATEITAQNVLAYQRQKNGQWAQVALLPEVAARLRSIPPESLSDPDHPMRFTDSDDLRATKVWRERFQKLCAFAGIREITTEVGRKKKPGPHMLRDTAAMSLLENGASLENVSRMLGHSSTAQTEKSYLSWTKQRVDFCVEDQRRALARRVELARGAARVEVAAGDTRPTTTVH